MTKSKADEVIDSALAQLKAGDAAGAEAILQEYAQVTGHVPPEHANNPEKPEKPEKPDKEPGPPPRATHLPAKDDDDDDDDDKPHVSHHKKGSK